MLGLYSFILEEHKDTYSVFYREVTGKPLQTLSVLGTAPTSATMATGLKRRVQSTSKEEPKIKKPKSEQKVRAQRCHNVIH